MMKASIICKKEKVKTKHVIALDVNKGKSTIAIYDSYCQCEFESETFHTRAYFELLHKKSKTFSHLMDKPQQTYLKQQASIQSQLKRFL